MLICSEVNGHNTIDMHTPISDAPEVLTIPLVLPLMYPKQTHPGPMVKANVLLLMQCFDCTPQWPGALVLILVKELKVKVNCQASNDTDCHPVRLVPQCKLLRILGCNWVVHLALIVLCVFDDSDMVVQGQVDLDGPCPPLEVALGEHWNEGSNMRIGRWHVDGSA